MKSSHLKLIVVAASLLLGLAVWWAAKHIKPDAPKRQVAKISILPDTPPPPPPPPKEEKKPEPLKDEPKQVMREEQIKPAEAPKPAEALKMEGAAGDGPSAFAAGSVAKDYAGGAPMTGGNSGPAGTASDRAQERFYANSARQQVRHGIEQNHRHAKRHEETQHSAEDDGLWHQASNRIAGDDQIGRCDQRKGHLATGWIKMTSGIHGCFPIG